MSSSAVIQETFRLGALHIDETVAHSASQATAQQRKRVVQSTVAGIDESMPFHNASLEDDLLSDEMNGGVPSTVELRQQLQELLTVRSPFLPLLW